MPGSQRSFSARGLGLTAGSPMSPPNVSVTMSRLGVNVPSKGIGRYEMRAVPAPRLSAVGSLEKKLAPTSRTDARTRSLAKIVLPLIE